MIVLLLYLLSATILVSALVPARITALDLLRINVTPGRRAAALVAATAALFGLLITIYLG